ncbi:MAG: DUF3854 domain-containing protein [Leptolyngbyaceae cyanobacterium bins.59]|nr:DUF3854 domain-containing protein [Leptolyngbyaceae cyanobacterium bins.59]
MTALLCGHDWMLNDFRSSGIPDRLTLANAQWLGEKAALSALIEDQVDKMQKVTSYVTRGVAMLLKKYEFVEQGGWIAYGTTLNGATAETPIFKPQAPRKASKGFGEQKEKLIKYETPPGSTAVPLLPFVDAETEANLYQKYKVTALEGETFWQVVHRCNLPIAITEGLKKALKLINEGIPAIALRGITCWHQKGILELHDPLKPFVTPDRKIHIIFDQDEKLATRAKVYQQILKLGTVLEKDGCKVTVPIWEPSEGKGIDDALVQQANPAQWLQHTLKAALGFQQYKRQNCVPGLLAAIQRLNRLSYRIERETEGEYLPELPKLKLGYLHALCAAMNSGKTYRTIRDWIAQCRTLGILAIVLAPLNSLGQQTAQEAGLPHIHDFGHSEEEQTALWAMVRHQGGLVLCPNSLHRLPDWLMATPIALFLDEANATIYHTLSGDTTCARYQQVTGLFAQVMRHAITTGCIVMAEANLPDRAVKLVQELAGVDKDKVRVFSHQKQADPWNCVLYQGPVNGFRYRLMETVNFGRKLLIVTSSQAEAVKLEKALAANGAIKVIRIDGQTNQKGCFDGFFNDPDQWLKDHQPDILILSPSARTGVSIEGGVSAQNAYFSEVWGYFSCLATDSHMQLLGRYRPPVPRHIYTLPLILGTSDEMLGYSSAISARWELNIKAMTALAGMESPQQTADEITCLNYMAAAVSVSGLQKRIAFDALQADLKTAGHHVTVTKVAENRATTQLWKTIQEQIWRNDAQKMAETPIDPQQHTLEWANDSLESMETTEANRIRALKVIYRHQFPGILFDDAEECYQSIIKDRGKLARGARFQAEAENPEALKDQDIAEARKVLSGQYRAFHKLPRRYALAVILQKTGILELLNLDSTYSNHDPRAIATHQICLKHQREILYWLRLQIKPEHTPIQTVNKLLAKLGLGAEVIRKEGSRGTQTKIWRVMGLDDPLRTRLLEAVRARLASRSLNSLIKEDPPIQAESTENSSSPKEEINLSPGQKFRWSRSGEVLLAQSIQGGIVLGKRLGALMNWVSAYIPLSEVELVV